MNRGYISRTDADFLLDKAVEYFVAAGLVPAFPEPDVRSWLTRVIDAVKNRVDHLDQLPGETRIIFGFDADRPDLDEDARETLARPEALAVAREFARRVEKLDTMTTEDYRSVVGEVKAVSGQKGKNLFHPIRAALTGRGSGLELERLIPLYEDGSRLRLPRRVMSCRDRLRTILESI
jgi:glutamyl/glutaminyl-tRNA synthetase